MILKPSSFVPTYRYLSTVFAPNDIVEMRIMLADGEIWSGRFDNLDVMAKIAAAAEQKWQPKATYYTLNPVDPSTADRIGAPEANRMAPRCRSSRDKDIRHRNLYLVDIDPVRPANVCATEQERAHAQALAGDVRQYLAAEGIVDPIVMDSGNGVALLYPTEPHTATSPAWNAVLAHLAKTFDTEHAKIDVSVKNAARVSRLPGSWNRKGADTPDRPHRRCTVTEYPATLSRMSPLVVAAMAAKYAPLDEEHKRSRAATAPTITHPDTYDLARPAPPRDPDAKFEFVLTPEGLHQIIAEFPEHLHLSHVTPEDGALYFALATCPFAGRAHTNQDVGKGKTAIILTPGNVGFRCFSDDCDCHTFADLMQLVEFRTQRRRKTKIWRRVRAADTINISLQEALERMPCDLVQEEEMPVKPESLAHPETAHHPAHHDSGTPSVSSPRQQYLASQLAESQRVDFELDAAAPNLLNYPVQPHLLYQAFLAKVDRIMAAARLPEIDFTVHLGPYIDEDTWRRKLYNAMLWTPDEMAKFVGVRELYYLLQLHIAQQWFPLEEDGWWHAQACDSDGEIVAVDGGFGEWFDGTDMDCWPHIFPPEPTPPAGGLPPLEDILSASPELEADWVTWRTERDEVERVTRERLCPPPPFPAEALA